MRSASAANPTKPNGVSTTFKPPAAPVTPSRRPPHYPRLQSKKPWPQSDRPDKRSTPSPLSLRRSVRDRSKCARPLGALTKTCGRTRPPAPPKRIPPPTLPNPQINSTPRYHDHRSCLATSLPLTINGICAPCRVRNDRSPNGSPSTTIRSANAWAPRPRSGPPSAITAPRSPSPRRSPLKPAAPGRESQTPRTDAGASAPANRSRTPSAIPPPASQPRPHPRQPDTVDFGSGLGPDPQRLALLGQLVIGTSVGSANAPRSAANAAVAASIRLQCSSE